jgi:hypothetical protein
MNPKRYVLRVLRGVAVPTNDPQMKGNVTMINRGRSLIILICLTLATAMLVKYISLRASAKDSTAPMRESPAIHESFLAHTTIATGITTPVKLCSSVQAFKWRDTMVVPDDWKAGTCQSFANSLGMTEYQLGCANPNSISWGSRNGSTPSENQCGW